MVKFQKFPLIIYSHFERIENLLINETIFLYLYNFYNHFLNYIWEK